MKKIVSYVLLSKGGINFFSKNFEMTMMMRNLLIKCTDECLKNPYLLETTKEENFKSLNVKLLDGNKLGNSVYDGPLISNLNQVLVNTSSEVEITEDFLIKMNFLQLRYFIELVLMVSF
jgi:hypothetical protein